MQYLISRTSLWDDSKPCDEAFKVKVKNIDRRTVSDAKDLQCMSVENWYSEGTNHTIVNGNIQRNLGEVDYWAVDIETIEDLNNLMRKYGDIIIRKSYSDYESLELEFYDEYH